MGKPNYENTAVSPAKEKLAVSLAADTTFPVAAKGIYVGTGGTVIVKAPFSIADVTYKNVPSGGYIDGWIEIVRSTANGTTAADLIADF